MKLPIRRTIKFLLQKFGYEIKKIDTSIPSDPFDVQYYLISLLNKDTVIFDVGANRGQSTEQYLKIFPKSTIFAFEPFRDSHEFLKNKFKNKNVRIYPYAVSNKSTLQTFYVNENDETSSLLPRLKSGRRYYSKSAGPKTEIQVKTITIDEFLNSNNISEIDILKLDIQGAELFALQGAENSLRNNKISLIYTEVFFIPHYENSPLFHNIVSLLEKCEYSLFNLYNLQRAKNGQLRYADAIFVSKLFRKNIIDAFPEEP